MIRRSRLPRPLIRIFAWPALIFVLGLAGLIIALTGDGWRDALAWAALGSSVLAVAWAMCVRRT